MRIGSALLACLTAASPAASACEAPEEAGGAPWRHAVARVRYLPETEAWAGLMQRERAIVQYVLLLDEPKYLHGRCYWTVEIRAEGKLWKRFLVTPDGKRVIEEEAR